MSFHPSISQNGHNNTYATPLKTQIFVKRVFVDDEGKRWETVKKILQEIMFPIYGKQTKLIDKAKTREDYKSRLLYADEKVVGLLIYKEKLVDNGLVLKSFFVFNQQKKSDESTYKSHLMQHVLKLAQDLRANSIKIGVPSTATSEVEYFKQNNFSIKESKNDISTLIRPLRLGSPIPQRALSNKSEESAKKRKFEEPYSDKSARSKIDEFSYQKGNTTHMTSNDSSDSPTPSPISCSIQGKYLGLIKSGKKTIEGRIDQGMFKRLTVGKEIQFFCGSEKVLCKVTDIAKYKSFKEMLEAEGYQACLPDVHSLDEAVNIYNNIRFYQERAKEHGVLAIHIKKV